MSNNYVEGKITVWTLGGAFAISTGLFVLKLAMAILTAIDRKVKEVDAWIADNLNFLEKITDFIDRGTINMILEGIVASGL